MRSELLALNSKCSLSGKCELCDKLGYRAHRKTQDPLKQIQSHLKNGVTGNLVLPCSTVEMPEFEKIIAQTDKISHLFLYRMWLKLDEETKNSFKGAKVAIIFDDLSELQKAILPEEFEVYFLLTPGKWSLAHWLELKSGLKRKVQFFYPANPYGLKTLFDVRQVYEITAEILKHSPDVSFKTPFGHDLLDERNSAHLDWIFAESKSLNCQISTEIPQLSIIVPTYNRSSFLMKIIRSLENQSILKSKFELIIVDDGSTDSTESVLRSYVQNESAINLKYYFVPRDLGVRTLYNSNRAGPIRNLGARKSLGEILLFLDSDILMPENYLETLQELHGNHDVVSPRRVYLNKAITEQESIDLSKISENDRMQTDWQDYLKEFYSTQNWGALEMPWKYFMTYCLSVRRELFFKSGGFRTNFISYGYEDLDWGYRVMQHGARLKYIPKEVFHLYHFDGGSEYTLSRDFRFFQLAMSSRIFVAQNLPVDVSYLIGMTDLKNKQQQNYFRLYSVLWKVFNFLRRTIWIPQA